MSSGNEFRGVGSCGQEFRSALDHGVLNKRAQTKYAIAYRLSHLEEDYKNVENEVGRVEEAVVQQITNMDNLIQETRSTLSKSKDIRNVARRQVEENDTLLRELQTTQARINDFENTSNPIMQFLSWIINDVFCNTVRQAFSYVQELVWYN